MNEVFIKYITTRKPERVGTKAGNKGWEAVPGVLEKASLIREM